MEISGWLDKIDDRDVNVNCGIDSLCYDAQFLESLQLLQLTIRVLNVRVNVGLSLHSFCWNHIVYKHLIRG